jgi:hypothetical protein
MHRLLSLLSLLCVAHAAPPKAAVVYLTTARSKDIAELKQSLVHTYENFLSLFPYYPVLVVHEGDFTPALEAEVLAVVPQMDVRIVLEPHFEPPPHIAAIIAADDAAAVAADAAAAALPDHEEAAPRVARALEPSFMAWKGRPTHWGYNNMIRWMVRGLFRHPQLGGEGPGALDYYMRLDTDSRLLSPLPEDPFERMRREGLVYMFYDTLDDVARFTRGLVDLAEAHVAQQPQEQPGGASGGGDRGGGGASAAIEPAWPAAWAHAVAHKAEPPSFYNNIEWGATAFFRRPGVRALVERIDQDGGIYRHRWGDATIRWLQLALFAREEQVQGFCGFDYDHDGRVRGEKMRCRRPGNEPSDELPCVCFQYSTADVWRAKGAKGPKKHAEL